MCCLVIDCIVSYASSRDWRGALAISVVCSCYSCAWLQYAGGIGSGKASGNHEISRFCSLHSASPVNQSIPLLHAGKVLSQSIVLAIPIAPQITHNRTDPAPLSSMLYHSHRCLISLITGIRYVLGSDVLHFWI